MAEDVAITQWRVSFVITTYNSVESLAKVIASVAQQTIPPLEIIVADDGSKHGVSVVLERFRKSASVRIVHSWQPDDGFRLSRSRNLAASKARGNWILFLDGDCVLPEYFLERHVTLADNMHFVFGSRKLLTPSETDYLQIGEDGSLNIAPYIQGRKFLSLQLGIFRKWPRRSWKQLRGFLIGIDAKLFQVIAGFDESYVSWGLEDSDFAVRAIRAGGFLKDGRYANAVLHLYHPEPSQQDKSANSLSFDALLEEGEKGRFQPLKSIFTDY